MSRTTVWAIVPALAIAPVMQAQSPVSAQESGQSQTQDSLLTGAWASETAFGPALHGELGVARRGEEWRATMSNAETTFQAAGDTVRFAFPGNLGQFRGSLTDSGGAITGFWLQPSSRISTPKVTTPTAGISTECALGSGPIATIRRAATAARS